MPHQLAVGDFCGERTVSFFINYRSGVLTMRRCRTLRHRCQENLVQTRRSTSLKHKASSIDIEDPSINVSQLSRRNESLELPGFGVDIGAQISVIGVKDLRSVCASFGNQMKSFVT